MTKRSSEPPNPNESVSGTARSTPAADDVRLRDSLADLSRLATGDGQVGFEDMLTHVAEFAVRAIPGAEGAGLTLFHEHGPDTVVASSPFVREVDALQYGLGEGPCITAAAERRTVRSGSLATDPGWPRFGAEVDALGVHSALSLPLIIRRDRVLGSMNVYAHPLDAFDERAAELGELFAVPAGISVQNGQALTKARRLAAQLQSALTSRAVIDQALGILMSRSGCTAGEAFEKLRVISQGENRKTSVVAQSIVDQAVRRARARNL